MDHSMQKVAAVVAMTAIYVSAGSPALACSPSQQQSKQMSAPPPPPPQPNPLFEFAKFNQQQQINQDLARQMFGVPVDNVVRFFGGPKIETDLTPNINVHVTDTTKTIQNPFSPGAAPDGGTQQYLDNMQILNQSNAGSMKPKLISMKLSEDADEERAQLAELMKDGEPIADSAGIVKVVNCNPGAAAVLGRPNAVQIETNFGQVRCDAGSAVMVLDNGRATTILDLHSDRSASVKIAIGGKVFTMAPGEQVVLTREAGSFKEVAPALGVAYRTVKSRDLDNGIKLHCAEFSIVSALTSIRPIKQQCLSGESGHQKYMRRIFKNAVIMSQM